MMYSCSLFVLRNGPRAPPYLDSLFSSLHQQGQGRPGARAAAFGLLPPRPAGAQGSPAPIYARRPRRRLVRGKAKQFVLHALWTQMCET